MSTLLKPLQVRGELLKRGVTIFSAQEFQRIFHAPPSRAKYFLEEYTHAGLFRRLKRGLYSLQDPSPSEEEIANLLYRPSYISFEYALAAHNLLPEMVYAVTSATPKPTRTFVVAEKPFSYLTIKKQAFTGYLPSRRNGRTILIAEPEKALVDYLYFVSLSKKALNDRLTLTQLDRNKIHAYARLYRRDRLDRLIRELL